MHYDTYSVHDHPLKPWRGHLPCFRTFCYMSFHLPCPDSTDAHCLPLGARGPPPPKVASPPLGSAHTPFPGSRTGTSCDLNWITSFYLPSNLVQIFQKHYKDYLLGQCQPCYRYGKKRAMLFLYVLLNRLADCIGWRILLFQAQLPYPCLCAPLQPCCLPTL